MIKMPPLVDIAALEEEDRILLMGRTVMKAPSTSADPPIMVAFVVEDEEKAARYSRKLTEEFPGIRIIDQKKNCPAPGMVTVRIGSPLR